MCCRIQLHSLARTASRNAASQSAAAPPAPPDDNSQDSENERSALCPRPFGDRPSISCLFAFLRTRNLAQQLVLSAELLEGSKTCPVQRNGEGVRE